MKSLKEYLVQAGEEKTAIGHFNFSNLEGFWAIFRAAQLLKLPVILGVSERERRFVGARQAMALVKSLREEFDYPVFLNADHCHSFESFAEAVDAQFDAVIFDGSSLTTAENTEITQKCVAYASEKNPEMLVEGELGYIGTSSKILDEVPEGVDLNQDALTTPEAARQFVEATGVSLFAPAVGNIHGMLRDRPDPALDISRVRQIKEAIGVPLVLHGASGNTAEDIKAAIEAGISIIHVNTEIRVAYQSALKQSLMANPDEVAPYKILKPVVEAMREVVGQKLRLFNRL